MLRIGLIDSGIGGFSILNSFLKVAQNIESEFLYIADSGHLPYGIKTDLYIHRRMERLTQYLLTLNIDVLVIACNTATAVSAEKLRTQFPNLPIIGIEPAIKPAATLTKTGHIAIAATQSTLKSQRLKNLIERYAHQCKVHPIIGSQWVTIVESDEINSKPAHKAITQSLAIFEQYPIDQLVLGCTHFPFLEAKLKDSLPAGVNIINPANSVVNECYKRLGIEVEQIQINNRFTPQLHLMTTGKLLGLIRQSALIDHNYIDKQSILFEKIES